MAIQRKKTAVKYKLKKNDPVMVIAGKDKGKTGRILSVDRERGRVVVEGVNLVKKAVRRRSANEPGGFVEVEAPIHISNVMYLAKDGKPTRLGYKFVDGKKVRYAKRTGEVV
ncbi:50S ribosomal protein L24 [Spirochaeta thermophila]|uniref:Large ribosomal subunit protein uL24 n=2 Tax=Winmispira thermophila TaxID=154 RepID=G0GFB0_WINT7|nr:50S ribosomal protein L24 [Spirochaeta thermophila]ADN01476.1 50S ribosomal protein L24 [Spirochaeta thermophila DSM 6192]AEJ60809.1 ribosomal protein L24 [Spirochaeta thermophila DSM 6578]